MDFDEARCSFPSSPGFPGSWFPAPFFLCRRILSFFIPKKCNEYMPCTATVGAKACSEPSKQLLPSEDAKIITTKSINLSKKVLSKRTFTTSSSYALKSPYGVTPAKQKTEKRRVEETQIQSALFDSYFRSGETSASSTVETEQCHGSCHFRSKSVNTASGPCPCYLSDNDPSMLRDFLREENICDSAQYKSVHKDYGVVTKQCSSLREEVDRLEASLGLLDEFGMKRSSSRESRSRDVRVVLYGDLGAALSDDLPKDSVSESLYAINVKLLNRLEMEKQKVEKRTVDHHAMTSQLEELVATVGSFQARFEERVSELHARLSHPMQSEQGFERTGGAESGFGDSNLLDADLDDSFYGKRQQESQSSSRVDGVELNAELRNIVMDLRKVAQEITRREDGWIDEQKSWTLFSADLLARLSSMHNLVLALKSVIANDRLTFDEAFGQLKSDLSTCMLCLGQIDVLLLHLVERETGRSTKEKSTEILISDNANHISREGLRGRVASWQEKISQVETTDTDSMAEIRREYDVLEERFQSTVKRLQNSGQEKMLLESTVEKLKDELSLAQYEREMLLKKNERSLMSLNGALSEKSAIEIALQNVTADLDSISSTRWALESSNAIMRDSLAGLQSRADGLQKENSRFLAENGEISQKIQQKQEELTETLARLEMSLQECNKLRQRKEELHREVTDLRRQLASSTCELSEQNSVLLQQESRLALFEKSLASSEENTRAHRVEADEHRAALQKTEIELASERGIITELRSLLDTSLKWQFHVEELAQAAKLEADYRIDLLTDEKKKLEDNANRQAAYCSDLLLQLGQMKDESLEKDSELQRLYATMEDRDKQLTKLLDNVEEVERLKSEIAESHEVLAHLRLEQDKSTAQLTEVQVERDSAIDRLLGQLDEKAQRIQELERDIDRYSISHGVVIMENERLQTDLKTKSGELSAVAGQLSEAAVEVARLQREISESSHQVSVKEADFRAEIVELEGARADSLVEIDRLQDQLASHNQHLEKLEEERSLLERSLADVRRDLYTAREQTRHTEEEKCQKDEAVATLEQEKILWQHNQRTYSELIAVLCSTILTSNMELESSSDGHDRRPNLIFTPDGVFTDDGCLSPDPTASLLVDNDSGFVGSQSGIDDGQAPVRLLSTTSTDLKGLFDEVTVTRLSANPSSNSLAPIHGDLQRAQAAIIELQSERRHSESVQRNLQNLTERVHTLTSVRDELSQDHTTDQQHISELSNEVDELTSALAKAALEHQVNQKKLEAKTKDLSEVTARLRETKAELDRVKDTGSRHADSIGRLNTMLLEKEDQINLLTEELKCKDVTIDALKEQTTRMDSRMRELLIRVSTNDARVTDLSQQLRETELRTGTAESLHAKEEAQKALDLSLDAKIQHLRDRESDIRKMEQKLAGFVTDQLELANREADSVRKSYDLELKETELKSRENDLTLKMVQLLRTEEKLRTIEQDMESKDEALILVKKDKATLEVVNQQLREEVDSLRKAVVDYEEQLLERTVVDENSVGEVGRLQNDIATLMAKLLQAEKDVVDSRHLLQTERSAHEALQGQLRLVSTDHDHLAVKMEALKFQSIHFEGHEEEVRRLQKMLAERSTQAATLAAEEKRLRHLLQSSESKLTTMRQTFEELEERLKNKDNGRNSLDSQFTTLNVLYADLLVKYRNLSDAYDEMEIEMVRSKDEHRDVKRELDKLSDFLRRHLGNGTDSKTFTISKHEMVQRESEPAITKDMISSLRSDLEQLLQGRLYDEFPSSEIIRDASLRPKSSSKKTKNGSKGSTGSSPRVLENSDSANLISFRGKVMDRLFESTSRENITRDELLNESDRKSSDSMPGSHGSV